MLKTWVAILCLFIGFFVGNLFQMEVVASSYRGAVFEKFFFKRSQCLSSEAYTDGKNTWVVEDNAKFVYIKGAPEPCASDGRQ